MYVEVPQDVIGRLNKQLESVPERIPEVLRKTINSTAQFGKKDIPQRVKEKYALKNVSRRVKERVAVYEPARGKNYQATIRLEGRPEPLFNFHVRKNGIRVSAKANVLSSSSLKDLTTVKDGETLKAFVVKIKNRSKGGEESHHVGVFRRYSKEELKVTPKAKHRRNGIKQLYSTSIPQMAKNDKVYPKIEEDIKEKLRENLEKHIAVVMEGMT